MVKTHTLGGLRGPVKLDSLKSGGLQFCSSEIHRGTLRQQFDFHKLEQASQNI